MSYTSTIYHIVTRTYRSERTIAEDQERALYHYIMGIVQNLGGVVYRIGGMPDHVHQLVSLPADISMADYVRQMKTMTSKWLGHNPLFPMWNGWSHEYAGFSVSERERDVITNYIRNQKEHHKKISFEEEYRAILIEHGIKINEKYFLVN